MKNCRIGRCSLICQVLCRIDDIRYVSLKNYVIIFLFCNLHRLKLDLISSKLGQYCQSGIGSECLSELVFFQVNWQHDGVPFIDILIERFLVEMENHIVISLCTLKKIVQIILVFIQYQVARGVRTCIEKTEIIKYSPLTIISNIFSNRTYTNTEADVTTTFWNLHEDTIEVLMAAIEFLTSIIHVLLADMQIGLFCLRHVCRLHDYSFAEGTFNYFCIICRICTFILQKSGKELSLICIRISLAFDNIRTAMIYVYHLIDCATGILDICAIIFTEMSLVIIHTLIFDSIESIRCNTTCILV